MKILVIAEQDDTAPKPAALHLMGAAARLAELAGGAEIDLLLAGSGIADAARAAAAIPGLARVLAADDAVLADGLAEPAAALIVGLAKSYDILMAPADTFGKNLMPRVAALLDVGQVSDVLDIKAPDTFVRPIYAGNALATVKSADALKILTVRPTAFPAVAATGGSATVEAVPVSVPAHRSKLISRTLTESARPELSAARVVVAGGRGIASEEGCRLLESLADHLGAAIGASRAAIDAGFLPNDLQIGQSGKIIAPEVYVAVGISGAVQHVAGMKDSRVIVAINKDEEAPIFQIADLGLVADLYKVLPELEKELDA